MKKTSSIIALLIFAFAFSVPLFVFAQATLSISSALPGSNATIGSQVVPGAFIANFYQLALMLGGILAFGAVVYGGVLYAVSAGNPSKQTEGKEWIEAALLGLLLLAGAYLILFTINPNLVNINLPTLSGVQAYVPPPPGSTAPPTGPGCSTGQCETLPNCTVTSRTNCGGAQSMVNVLDCINNTDPNYAVNEGYPPVGGHSDPGHNTGCAIDVHVSNCAAGSQFMAAAQQCGASKVLNEYTQCGGKGYQHTSGGNIHIDAPPGNGC